MGISDLIGSIIDAGTAIRNEKLAKETHRQTETANRIAEEGVVAAKGANNFAFNANQIAEQSNLIDERTLDASRDQTSYHWDVIYDREERRLVVRLLNSRNAHDVSVIVRLDGEAIGRGCINLLPGGEEFSFPTTLSSEDFIKRGCVIGTVGRRTTVIPVTYINVMVYIDYTSDLGVARSDHFQVAVSQSD